AAQVTPVSQERTLRSTAESCINLIGAPPMCTTAEQARAAPGFGLFADMATATRSGSNWIGEAVTSQNSTVGAGPRIVDAMGSSDMTATRGPDGVAWYHISLTADGSELLVYTFDLAAPAAFLLAGDGHVVLSSAFSF